MYRTLVVLFVSALAAQAAGFTADSARGERLFETLACVQCHSVNGKGGTIAPDLGLRIDRGFTPGLARGDHVEPRPTMWSAMRDRNVQAGDLSDQGADDLFAYFYSARFFDKPGDAARGKRLFSSKHCAECHGLTNAKLAEPSPFPNGNRSAIPWRL